MKEDLLKKLDEIIQAKKEVTDKHLPTAMDIYQYLWRCRDFELEHLWHRSVVLAVFVLAVSAFYTGYMKEFFIPKYMQETQTEYRGSDAFSLHTEPPIASANSCAQPVLYDAMLFGLFPIAITLLGLAFSVLWITMAKGSKAWYELYESNIAAISRSEKFWEGDGSKNPALTSRFSKKQGGYKAYLFGNLKPDLDASIDLKLFSVNAGPFSVLKVNTMIGIISLTAFLCAFVFHVYWTLKLFNTPKAEYGVFTLMCFVAELITALFIFFGLKNKVGSSFFYDFWYYKKTQMPQIWEA
ncbi:MAG: RipA family octameric membrane protein [Treponema sp.]